MMLKEQAYQKIAALVERFNDQKEFYKRADYNETLTRRDFIDPFFKALGWDVDNEQGYAESYREVIHEDKIKIGSATKAPDYSFRLAGGKRLFFVEAKKPSVFIKDEITPAYQVRRYGWSAKLPISIITDFEEFAIYDCTKKPNATDKASQARIKYFTYQNYLTEFDFIWETFSKEKVLKGSFDKFIQNDKQKKGTATVDYEFLISLDTWRTYLANNIALRNNIDEDELNFVVQQIIDRIIFLRIAEDRSVEIYGNLKDAIKTGNYYQNLLKQFYTADQKYNSGLFDFSKDKVSSYIEIDNKIIKSIIDDLYYPICPYEFSVLAVEILGSAYEQFLGKTISLAKNGKAVIEEKPEVRKAGGVYYTPQYIVDYIVENTVGKIINNKTPQQISKLKILDPACGSGSFLIGAYQYLLQYHKNYYSNNGKPSKGNKTNPLTPEGNLTTAEKKRILLNNIFGVDLDANAVEVTKLSLLLKCMEGETQASIETQLKLFHERVLPTLDNNIKDGNSLIDIDFYSTEIDFGEDKKIKPFNWKKEFADVFKQGGFDCVIGNPPYLSVKEMAPIIKKYFINKFEVAIGQFDLYSLFIEISFHILNKKGIFGMITSNTYLSNKDTIKLRKFLINSTAIEQIINLGESVFKDANLDVSILIFNKEFKDNNQTRIVRNRNYFDQNHFEFINQNDWSNENNNYQIEININSTDAKLLTKLFANKVQLKDFVELPRGIEIGSNSELIKNNSFKKSYKLLVGKDIKEYTINFNNRFISFQEDKSVFKTLEIYQVEKLLIQRIRNLSLRKRIVATIDTENYLCTNTLRIGILKKESSYNLKLILGLLNSNLINWLFLKKFLNKDIYAYQLEQIPLPQMITSLFEKEIVKLVNQLLQLNIDKQNITLQTKIHQLQNRIDYCEQRINEIVYQLYGLTKDEIALVENA